MFFQNISTPALCVGYRLIYWHCYGHGFLQFWYVKCNLPLTYAYSACHLSLVITDGMAGNQNQSAAIFLPPCALVYDVMPFCVDANMTTGEVGYHLLINFPLFLTRDGRSMSAKRCQHLMVSGRHAMSTNI